MPVVDIYATWRVVYSQRQRAIVKNRYFSKFKFQNFVHVERSGFQWEVRLRYFCWAKTTSAQLMCTITAPEKPNFHVWCCAFTTKKKFPVLPAPVQNQPGDSASFVLT